ncbi:MAG: GntR family transcriptional regulator [Lachnospiraceae bacterium]|nr:GntR family transcriptional regulator [Lachnospiraceae bacterium]
MNDYELAREVSDKYSLRGRVFTKIRDDILNGRYKENEELKEIKIGKELGVSRTPVREALRQLELEGLVRIIPNRGAFVTGIQVNDVHDIYMIRARLEGLCARWATERISKEQLDAMEENVYLAEYHAAKGHMEQIADLDNQFHHILYDACGSKMLEHLLIDYHQYVQRVRRMTLSTISRSTASNKEHRAIMEAIRAGNADLAEKLASEHMYSAYENMLRNGLNEIYPQQEGGMDG